MLSHPKAGDLPEESHSIIDLLWIHLSDHRQPTKLAIALDAEEDVRVTGPVLGRYPWNEWGDRDGILYSRLKHRQFCVTTSLLIRSMVSSIT